MGKWYRPENKEKDERKRARKKEEHKRRKKFWKRLQESGSVTTSAKYAGVSMSTAWRWKNDPRYSSFFDRCLEFYRDKRRTCVDNATYARATHGWLEPVYHEGKIVGYKKKFSDTLALAFMKMDHPELRERVSMTQNNANLITDELEGLEDVLNKALSEEAKRVNPKG